MTRDLLALTGGRLQRDGRPWTPAESFLAVVGDPVSHSLSPALQGAALQERGLDHEYLALGVPADELAGLRTFPGCEHLVGCNITSPHKQAVAGMCDALTPAARRLGAVNTVRREEDGTWTGHNTDSGGLLMVLSAVRGQDAQGTTAAVLGTGGAARAAVDALCRWGAPLVTVFHHTAEAGERFRSWLEEAEFATPVQVLPLAEAADATAGVWINALARDVSIASLLPVAAPTEDTVLLDLRYGAGLPAEQLPLGFRAVDGLPLLVMQGGLSFAWWFGPPVPWDAMRKAVAPAG